MGRVQDASMQMLGHGLCVLVSPHFNCIAKECELYNCRTALSRPCVTPAIVLVRKSIFLPGLSSPSNNSATLQLQYGQCCTH